MGKRGQMQHDLMITIFDLVLIGMLLLSLMGYVSSIKSKDFVKKEFLAKDLALLINSVYISPRDISVYYDSADASISDFTFEFDNQRATVYETEVEKGAPVRVYYPFGVDRNTAQQFAKIVNPDRIVITKSADTVYIGESDVPTEIKTCPDVYTTRADKNDVRIMIDSGHGGSDPGFEGVFNEAKLTFDLAKQLGSKLHEFDIVSIWDLSIDTSELPLLSPIDDDERLKMVKLYQPDMLVSLHAGKDQDTTKEDVIIYINFYNSQSVRNKKLACLIRNGFIEHFSDRLDKVVVRYIKPEQMGDPRVILSTKEMSKLPVAVYIEMGNINAAADSSILATEGNAGIEGSLKIINEVLAPAIRQYYE